MITVPVEVSNHHLHLSAEDLTALFGPAAELHVRRPISQTGQFAAAETVTLAGPKGEIERVRIVGPVRAATQVEISASDAATLGVDAPLRDSGQLAGSPGIGLVGPSGRVDLAAGVIRQRRHIHASPSDCQPHGLTNGQTVKVQVNGHIFDDVYIKVDPTYVWRLHLDTDEARQARVVGGEIGEVML